MKGWLVTAGGLGRLRPASGTWGSTPPCILVFAMLMWGTSAPWINLALLVTLVASCVICVVLGPWSETQFGGKDPSAVVIDEVAGMALSLLFVPLNPMETSHPWLAGGIIIGAAFLLFRIFDIVKSPPANVMQQFPAGWGILLDDLVAGLYANLILQVFLRVGFPLMTMT